MGLIDLLDINVWIAMSSPSHTLRNRAEEYWHHEAAPQVAFTNVTMLGLVRICSSAPIFDGNKLSATEAWELYRHWARLPEVAYLAESPRSSDILDRFVSLDLVGPRTWTDAYLASISIAESARLVSFDRDYLRFEGLNLLTLA